MYKNGIQRDVPANKVAEYINKGYEQVNKPVKKANKKTTKKAD